MSKWIEQYKGSYGEYFEYSAIKESNKHGQESYGWGGLNKIILFGSGLGDNSLNPHTKEQDKEARDIVKKVVMALNTNETPLDE